MSAALWQQVRRSLEQSPCKGRGYEPLPLPTDEMINAAQEELGVCFPDSYREFVKVFGGGVIYGTYVIKTPGTAMSGPGKRSVDLISFHNWSIKNRDFDRFEDPELAQRLIVFGNTLDGHDFGWDLVEEFSADTASQECTVRLRPRDGDECPVVAESFAEFIEDFCRNGRDDEFLGGNGFDPPKTFEPFCRKKKPRK